MANGKIRFGKQSGGELALVIPDGVDNTEVIVPESGELATKEYIDNTTVKLTGNQTIAGVKTFSSSPIVPTPTANTQAVNKAYADLKVALADFTGANVSLSGSGYQKLPSGLIIQWGISGSNVSSGVGVVNAFPITFPNAVFSCVLQYADASTPSTKALINIYSLTTSAVLYNFSESGNRGIYFIAIGY